jgi:hypothetical protein
MTSMTTSNIRSDSSVFAGARPPARAVRSSSQFRARNARGHWSTSKSAGSAHAARPRSRAQPRWLARTRRRRALATQVGPGTVAVPRPSMDGRTRGRKFAIQVVAASRSNGVKICGGRYASPRARLLPTRPRHPGLDLNRISGWPLRWPQRRSDRRATSLTESLQCENNRSSLCSQTAAHGTSTAQPAV